MRFIAYTDGGGHLISPAEAAASIGKDVMASHDSRTGNAPPPAPAPQGTGLIPELQTGAPPAPTGQGTGLLPELQRS